MNVLVLCGRNKRRSPTAERILRQWPDVHARSAGFSSQSPRTLRAADLEWADVVLVMENEHKRRLRGHLREALGTTRVVVLGVPDIFERDDPELVALLTERMRGVLHVE